MDIAYHGLYVGIEKSWRLRNCDKYITAEVLLSK